MQPRKNTPADAVETGLEERTRIPMSLPILKLSVPDIPGYHLHWMRGDPARIQQALRAGYEFVKDDEVTVNNVGVGDDPKLSGNQDLGTNVSVSAGQELDRQGNPEVLVLMKLRLEYWEEDQAKLQDRNENMAASLRGEPGGEGAYIPQAHKKTVENMFTRKR